MKKKPRRKTPTQPTPHYAKWTHRGRTFKRTRPGVYEHVKVLGGIGRLVLVLKFEPGMSVAYMYVIDNISEMHEDLYKVSAFDARDALDRFDRDMARRIKILNSVQPKS